MKKALFPFAKLLVFLLVFVLNISCGAGEEPFCVYLTWQNSPESTMSIQWISQKDRPDDVIEFQRQGENVWHRSFGKHTLMPYEQPYVIHFVELKGLHSAAVYRFRIGQEEKIYKFRTMPSNPSFPIHFVVGGDMYNGSLEMLEKTNRAAAAKDPLFVVIGGDIAYGATSDLLKPEDAKKWLDWLKVWNKTMITPDGYLIPILPVLGNHEVRGGTNGTPNEAEFFFSLFPLPGLEGYNVLDFGHYLSFFLLDSGHTNTIQGTQTDWLKNALMLRQQVPHKFAVYHIPAYPSYRSYNALSSRTIRKYWVPLFEQYGLTAAFENNDHAYKRTPPIFRGKAQGQGVLYLGDGAWSVGNVRKPKTPKQAWYIAKSVASQYFMVVTLNGNHRSFQAFTPDGVLFDQF